MSTIIYKDSRHKVTTKIYKYAFRRLSNGTINILPAGDYDATLY